MIIALGWVGQIDEIYMENDKYTSSQQSYLLTIIARKFIQ